MADLLVTPAADVLPPFVPRERIVEIEWGGRHRAVRARRLGAHSLRQAPGTVLAVFASAFRAWHGAVHLVRAIRDLRTRGRRDLDAVLIGDGPELAGAKAEAGGIDGLTSRAPWRTSACRPAWQPPTSASHRST